MIRREGTESLTDADLVAASFADARLGGADFGASLMVGVDLTGAKLEGANLRLCDLSMAVLAGAKMAGAQVAQATFDRTILTDVDLSEVRGLARAYHEGPSSVGVDTLERTLAAVAGDAKRRQEVESFFRAAGIQDHLLAHYRRRAGADERGPCLCTS